MNTPSNRPFNRRGWGRGLKKSAILSAALAFLLLFAGKGQIVHAASLTVTTTDDELNSDGDCSLREAIQAANTNAAVDVCPAGEPAPAIDIITFGVTGTITHQSGQVVITDDLTIHGPGASNLSFGTGGYGRVLAVQAGVTLSLSDLTLANNYGEAMGGAIYNDGMVAVADTIFSGNSAGNGGAINNSPSGTLIVSDTTFSQNLGQIGGAIRNEGMVIVTDTTFSGNFTSSSGQSGSGAGIFNIGTVDVTDSTFAGNFAAAGAGIFNTGTLTVTNTTFSANTASSEGGGIRNVGTLTVTNSTFSGNSAQFGGGIVNSGAVTLLNTIVANSLSGGNCQGAITDGGGNLSWPDSACPGINQDPLLDPAGLQDNGGSTKTIALQPGSPAIDAAVAANCPAADQRGVTRPQGAACDIGAYELEQTPQDTTAPTIVITTPADGATYLLGQVVLADYACADEAGGSGLTSCVGTVPNGSPIDTASVGDKTFTVDAADNAGNTNSASVSYAVIYSFDGFYAPVDNLPIFNVAKAGQIIALKWRITDANSVPVTNLTSATVTAVSLACDLGATTDQMEEYASGASGLQYLGDGYYQFNWKTPKSYANSCKTLKLNLGEGSGVVHELLFKFTK